MNRRKCRVEKVQSSECRVWNAEWEKDTGRDFFVVWVVICVPCLLLLNFLWNS